MFTKPIEDLLNSINAITNAITAIGQNSGLLSDLNTWNSTLNGYANAIAEGVVKPVAYTLFALFSLLELIQITQKASAGGGSNMYTVQQVCMALLKFVLCKLAIDYSTTVVNAIFAVTAIITRGISNFVGSGGVESSLDVAALMAGLGTDFGSQVSVSISLNIVSAILWLERIAVSTVVGVRFIELYVYNAMAPLSLTTFGSQELHGIGINFLKSYFAVALQGAVLYFIIGCYPALAAGLLSSGNDIASAAWGMASSAALLLVAVLSSGKFTKAITNAMT